VKLHDEYADRGLMVVGVTEETVGAVFVWSRDVGWTGKIPVAVDENARLRRMFGVTSYPTTAVIDTTGVLRWIAAGASEADLRAQIEQYLPPAPPKEK
jgi:alkyl hydroperoxide reductase subunit AhpC